MLEREVDILIIGGGLIGATLMLALQGLGFSALLVERKPFSDKINPDFDARSLALSPASTRILSMLGVWDLLKPHATAINNIHVSDQFRFGVSRLNAKEDGPLGHVLEIHYINQAVQQLLPQEKLLAPATLKELDLAHQRAIVTTESGSVSIKAQLIVAADGAESTVRELCQLTTEVKDYQQHAIVANIGLTKSHENRAYERFTAQGPLALLPVQEHRMALVWAMAPQKAKTLMTASDTEFLRELQSAFGYRLGRLVKVGKRFTYPLKQVLMPQQVKWPVVFVGNAAHTLHPVAGQGFNLGLRDVAALAQCIAHYGLNKDMLDHYMQLRSTDQRIITSFSNGLISLFTSRFPGVGLARNLGLIALDNSTTLKNWFARYAQGFSGVIPDLVCQIALETKELK